MARSYGPVATAFHLSVDFLTVGCFYLAIRSGVDVKAVLAAAESMLGGVVDANRGRGPQTASTCASSAACGGGHAIRREIED